MHANLRIKLNYANPFRKRFVQREFNSRRISVFKPKSSFVRDTDESSPRSPSEQSINMYAFASSTPLPPAHRTATTPSTCAPRMSAAPVTRRSFTLSTLSLIAASLLPTATPAQTTKTAPVDLPKRTKQATELRRLVRRAITNDPTIAATLLRLAFHDSFTIDLVSGKGGANGSIRFETDRGENFGLARAVDALRPMQAATALGWGDVVAVAGAEAVEATGGPHIDVQLGRFQAEEPDPTGILPSLVETVPELRQRFHPRGFTDRDLVALSGAHTLGKMGGQGQFVRESNKFKNDYFKNLMWYQDRRERGLSEKVPPPDRPNFQLPSDMHLLEEPETLAYVREFADSQDAFFKQFVESYNKMVTVGTPFASMS